jgi:hypothetical protein
MEPIVIIFLLAVYIITIIILAAKSKVPPKEPITSKPALKSAAKPQETSSMFLKLHNRLVRFHSNCYYLKGYPYSGMLDKEEINYYTSEHALLQEMKTLRLYDNYLLKQHIYRSMIDNAQSYEIIPFSVFSAINNYNLTNSQLKEFKDEIFTLAKKYYKSAHSKIEFNLLGYLEQLPNGTVLQKEFEPTKEQLDIFYKEVYDKDTLHNQLLVEFMGHKPSVNTMINLTMFKHFYEDTYTYIPFCKRISQLKAVKCKT